MTLEIQPCPHLKSLFINIHIYMHVHTLKKLKLELLEELKLKLLTKLKMDDE